MEVAVLTFDSICALVLTHIEPEILGYAPVVFQSLRPIGLLVEAGHWKVADFEELRRGKEGHVRRVVIERISQATLLQQDDAQIALLNLDRAG